SDINMDRLLGKGSGSGASLGDLARSLIKGGNGGNSAADLNKLLAGVSKRKAGDGENPGLSGLTLNELLGLGIHRLRPGMNIFQKASRSYKSFDRWRKKATRLAQVP